MGFMRHDVIIVTSWNRTLIDAAHAKATELGLEVLGPSKGKINGVCTIFICPDGSKEGWPKSDDGDIARATFIDFLKSNSYDDGSTSLEWVALRYGNELNEAETTMAEIKETS